MSDTKLSPEMQNWVSLAIEHAEANGRLAGIADHLAPKEDPGCDQPVPNPDPGVERCGSCYPCILWMLREAVERVKATQVTFSELETAAAGDSNTHGEEED